MEKPIEIKERDDVVTAKINFITESVTMPKDKYDKLMQDLDEFKKEHYIMKKFIYTKGLWNEFLNYEQFVEYLREDYKGDKSNNE